MDEQPISYFIMGAPEDNAWRTARKWPLPEVEKIHFYFHEGPSESVNSTNDGLRNSTYASYVTLPVISSEAITAPELGNLLIIIVITIVLTVAVVSLSWYVKSKTKK